MPSNFTAKPLPIRGLAQFKWQAPKPSKLGFKVKGYLIKCKAGKREKLERVPVNQTSTIIKGLYPGLRYVVSVASITQMGIGPFCCQKSDFVVLHTHGGQKCMPFKVHAKCTMYYLYFPVHIIILQTCVTQCIFLCT